MAKKVDSRKSVVGSIEEQAHYKKVGRLRKPIADAIRRKAADIYISENYLRHVFLRHNSGSM